MIPSLETLNSLVSDPFFTRTDFSMLTKKFVDADHPASTDSGPGTSQVPYRTLVPVQHILPGTAVIVKNAQQPYKVPNGGMTINGTANSPAIITGYGGRPVLDALPYAISCNSSMPTTPGDIRVRQIVDASGSNCKVEMLELRNGFRHNVVFRGVRSILRDTILRGAFEDAIKIANTPENPSGADWGLIERNDVAGFASQGIDMFGASNWNIRANTFGSPQPDPVTGTVIGNAVGIKGGSKNVVVIANAINACNGIVLGGAGNNFSVATEDCVAGYNSIVAGPIGAFGITLPSTLRGQVYKNQIEVTNGMGIDLGLNVDVQSTVTTPRCQDTIFGDNQIIVHQDGACIRVASIADAAGLISGGNTYGLNKFVYNDQIVELQEFQSLLNTDFTSLLI